MSGFITTMFVSPSAEHHIAFPVKAKPLLPIFTFAQSQSCMNLRMDLDILDARTGFDCSRSELDLERPKEAYLSPLQKIGEALRIQQSSAKARSDAKSSTPKEEVRSPPESKSPARSFKNFSYKLLPSDSASTPDINTTIDPALCSVRDSIDTGSIIGPRTQEQEHASQNKGYFPGTSLLSFFRNPRTRAPFKPQKSNRGTSSWQLKQYAEATLGSGSLRKAVKLPEGEDKDEWLAVNGKIYCSNS
jgi:MOB kinase activator 1